MFSNKNTATKRAGDPKPAHLLPASQTRLIRSSRAGIIINILGISSDGARIGSASLIQERGKKHARPFVCLDVCPAFILPHPIPWRTLGTWLPIVYTFRSRSLSQPHMPRQITAVLLTASSIHKDEEAKTRIDSTCLLHTFVYFLKTAGGVWTQLLHQECFHRSNQGAGG